VNRRCQQPQTTSSKRGGASRKSRRKSGEGGASDLPGHPKEQRGQGRGRGGDQAAPGTAENNRGSRAGARSSGSRHVAREPTPGVSVKGGDVQARAVRAGASLSLRTASPPR
jgi:hypothetical protein